MIFDRPSAHDVTAEDIKDLLRDGQRERSDLEFKQASDRDLPKHACAIANYGGGFILWGVQEDAEHRASGISAIPNSRDEAERAGQTIRDAITPRVDVEVATLTVDHCEIIIIQVLPSNAPHMVSKENHTDFYGRYNASTMRMHYDDIQQMFWAKREPDLEAPPPKELIDTTSGRISVSVGAEGVLEKEVQRIISENQAFALVAVAEGIQDHVTDTYAHRIIRQPLYDRRHGWLVADPEVPLDFRSGEWQQRRDPDSLTRLTPSGDLIFATALSGSVLCPWQDELDSVLWPLLYPNAIAEYCLSFAYALADVAATSKQTHILAKPLVLAGTSDLRLPLGAGGTKLFTVNCKDASPIINKESIGLTVAEGVMLGTPLRARTLAFDLLKQIYSFFGYNPSLIPFANYGEVRFGEPDDLTASSIRTYLRAKLMMPVQPPADDFENDGVWFGIEKPRGRQLFRVSHEFISDHHWSEAKLFELLDEYETGPKILAAQRGVQLLLSNEGIIRLP
jgi:Putative DNA-binding domain